MVVNLLELLRFYSCSLNMISYKRNYYGVLQCNSASVSFLNSVTKLIETNGVVDIKHYLYNISGLKLNLVSFRSTPAFILVLCLIYVILIINFPFISIIAL